MGENRQLTTTELGVLALERDWPFIEVGGSKRQYIREHLSISPARYYALLAELIDTETAAAADPLTVRRLRRRRYTRRRATFSSEPPRQRRPH